MIKREMVGTADLTGQRFGLLKVMAMVSRYPSPRYSVRCERCGSESTMAQRELSQGSASCRNSACGREGLHEEAHLTLRQFQRREEQREQRRIDELKSQFEATARRVAEVERDTVLNHWDADAYIDPATAYERMTEFEAFAFNEAEAQRFVQAHPAYYPCPENMNTILGYLQRNGIDQIVSAETLAGAYRRLSSVGGLVERPVLQPVHAAVLPEVIPARVESPAQPERMIGYDLRTGQQREFTPYEVDRMGSDEYRRTFRIYKSALAVPNVGPGARRTR